MPFENVRGMRSVTIFGAAKRNEFPANYEMKSQVQSTMCNERVRWRDGSTEIVSCNKWPIVWLLVFAGREEMRYFLRKKIEPSQTPRFEQQASCVVKSVFFDSSLFWKRLTSRSEHPKWHRSPAGGRNNVFKMSLLVFDEKKKTVYFRQLAALTHTHTLAV